MHRLLCHGLLLLALLLPPGLVRAALLNTGNSSDMANSASQISLSLPTDLRPGDLLIAQIAYRDTSESLTVPNARWSLLRDTANGANIRQRIYVRTVVAADVAGNSETWSVSGGATRMAGGLSGWRSSVAGVYPGIEQSRSDTGSTSGGGNNITAPGITAANGGQLLRLFGVSYGNGFEPTPAGFTEYYRPESGAGPNGASLLGVGRAISLPGATGSDTVSVSGSGSYVVHTLFLYEPASVAARLSWSLDETSWTGAAGEVLDASGNGLNGSVFNGANTASLTPALPPVNAQGTCGYGGFNSSSSQYVQRADSNLLDLQGSFTIGLWVKPRSLPTSGLMSILSKDENYEFHLNPDGTINWWWQTTGPAATREFNSTTALTVGQWSHVLIRFAPGDQRIYIDGNLAGQASFSGTPAINDDPLQLGADQNLAGRFFNGELDELRIYSGALSEAQISALVAERHQCALSLQCFNDDFNDGSLGEDWAVASRGATTFTPTVSSQRMRLTSNQGNVSTSSTLQRLFPAAGNYIQVRFKHYAYNGSGADGVALVLSDASVTPQPGAFGGPLGYGTRGDAANPGFAGGWLGVGIDEYGNFSTEGGPGGPGQRADSVALRGSGDAGWISGYRYIAGTAAGLNPGIDNAASTSAAPGHTYRITMDGRFGNEARVTVERDTGSGFVVLPNLNAVNVLAATDQAPLPGNFYLSLTGSTGGSTNTHELDDLQVCATNINPVGQQVDHFELVYDTVTPLTCNPLPVTVRACSNAACTQLYTGTVTVDLIPGSGWIGGVQRTFTGGQATFNLQVTSPGSVSLGIANPTPQARPNSQTVCSSANCQVTFVDSGLFFDIPTQLANKESGQIVVAARRTNPQTQKCEPSFTNVTRSVSFWSDYLDPAPADIQGVPRIALRSGSTPSQDISIDSTSPTAIPLAFDADAMARIWVRYPDAGKLRLNARHLSDQAFAVGSDDFVSKPYGLCLQTASTCSSADAECDLFPGGIRAGDSFPLSIKAVSWESDSEQLIAAALCDNAATPNFRLDGIRLTGALRAPLPGDPGSITPAAYTHALGEQTSVDASVSEVGVFSFTAQPPEPTPSNTGYFGETVSGGTSGLVGRFAPAYLGAIGSASLTPSCGSVFSYQGQPMGFAAGLQPSLTITGYSRGGGVTTNYDRGAFWKLAAPSVGSYASITGVAGRDARLVSQGTATLDIGGADDGDGARNYSWSGQQLVYNPPSALPGTDDYPFTAEIQQSFPAASLTDTDGACHGDGSACADFSYEFEHSPGSEVRLGRLRIGNAHGSELQGLELPLTLESWQTTAGGSFQREGLDTCTVLGAAELDGFTGNLANGETVPVLSGPSTGIGSLMLSAPGNGNAGSVQVSFPSAPAWLQYPWDGTNRSAAHGLATFGIYKGAAPLIFRRELYR